MFCLFLQEKVNYLANFKLDCIVKDNRGEVVSVNLNYKWRLYRGIENDLYAPTTVEIPPEE